MTKFEPTDLPGWKVILLWGLLIIFVCLSLGAFARYRKYRRLEDLFHSLTYFGACLWGFCQGILLPFLIGLGAILLVGKLSEYCRRKRDHPKIDEISRSLFDDKASQRNERVRLKIIDAAFEDPDNRELKELFHLTKDDFGEVFEKLLNSRPWHEAELALHDPEILKWFLTNVGLNKKFTPDQAVEFGAMIARNAQKHR
jgi:hypothetical protein